MAKKILFAYIVICHSRQNVPLKMNWNKREWMRGRKMQKLFLLKCSTLLAGKPSALIKSLILLFFFFFTSCSFKEVFLKGSELGGKGEGVFTCSNLMVEGII